MEAWASPVVPSPPSLPGRPRVFDTASQGLVEVGPSAGEARFYACGITPYDATHMGHANTYVTFDLLNRAFRDCGLTVNFTQNITDVDDPLLERAEATGVDWRDLAAREIALFGQDMQALRVLPPEVYLGAVETIPLVVDAVRRLEASGAAYRVDAPDSEGGQDVYFDVSADPGFGSLSHLSREEMLALFAERGGDPERAGKRDPLDPLLWRAARAGEPRWDGGALGEGRPGWHIECVAIAQEHLPHPFDVNGGGSDLVFPHHEMGVSHSAVLAGPPYARGYAHVGMVGLDGHKMSKSRGNLVKVSVLRAEGVDPMAVRLALLEQHYRSDWMWTPDLLGRAQQRLAAWRAAFAAAHGAAADEVVAAVRSHVANDLDSPAALAAVDAWVQQSRQGAGPGVSTAPAQVAQAVDSLLGIV